MHGFDKVATGSDFVSRTLTGTPVRQIVESLAIAELSREILRRATEPFPRVVRTLDALHLATLTFLQDQGLKMELASYDRGMIEAAQAMAIPLAAF